MKITAFIDTEAAPDGQGKSEVRTCVQNALIAAGIEAIVESTTSQLIILIDQVLEGPDWPLAIVRGCKGIKGAHVSQAIVRTH